MKRRKCASTEMSSLEPPAVGGSSSEPIQLTHEAVEASTQVHPGVLLLDGCEVVVSNTGKALVQGSGRLPPMEELSLNGVGEKLEDVDFNDRFPDELLLNIFKHHWSPVDAWNLAKVCKRWCILQANTQLLKRSSHISGRYPCTGSKKSDRSPKTSRCDSFGKDLKVKKVESDRSPKTPRCNGFGKDLKVKKVESEWRLAMNLLESCKRHTHLLEIKDCTHVSLRGYQLILGFASNLKSIRLGSCKSLDDPTFDAILDRCPSLRFMHLSMVPKLTLRNIENKAPKLQELHVYGCPTVTATTVLSVLKVCPNLRALGLKALGVSRDWDESKIVQGPPFRLQDLELANSLAVTDGFLQALAERLSNLRKLDLSNCLALSDVGLKAIIGSCGSGLQRLVVTRCPGISDDSVRALAGLAANLQDISLAGTNVSDDGLKVLMDSKRVVSKLRNLSVACCQRVTDAGLQHLVSKQKQLVSFRTLDVQSCPEVSLLGLENSMVKKWKIVSDKRQMSRRDECTISCPLSENA